MNLKVKTSQLINILWHHMPSIALLLVTYFYPLHFAPMLEGEIVWLITPFFIVMMVYYFWPILLNHFGIQEMRTIFKQPWMNLILLTFILLCSLMYGELRLKMIENNLFDSWLNMLWGFSYLFGWLTVLMPLIYFPDKYMQFPSGSKKEKLGNWAMLIGVSGLNYIVATVNIQSTYPTFISFVIWLVLALFFFRTFIRQVFSINVYE